MYGASDFLCSRYENKNKKTGVLMCRVYILTGHEYVFEPGFSFRLLCL